MSLPALTNRLYDGMRKARDFLIFSQERVGKDGETFTIYKFRTMRNGEEDDWEHLTAIQGRGKFGGIIDDPRVTYIGKFLRRYRLDELPQLWNILAEGNMSFIGVRPLEPKVHYHLPEEQRSLREQFLPGFSLNTLADYFVIENEDDLRESDARYLRSRTKDPKTDIQYFFRTLATARLAFTNLTNSMHYGQVHPLYAALFLIN